MVAIGLICAFFVLRADFARRKVSADAEAIIGITGLAGLAGSRLYHVLEDDNRAEFFADPWPRIFSTMGVAFCGAVIGGFIALMLLARRFRMKPLLMLDAASPAAALGYGIGRIGCLISGDGDYGIPTSLPWGMSFPNGTRLSNSRFHSDRPWRIGSQLRVKSRWLADSTQLCAFIRLPSTNFLARFVIFWFSLAVGSALHQNARAPYGMVFAAYLVLTGIARYLFSSSFALIRGRSTGCRMRKRQAWFQLLRA